ncbi:efflux RND transporter periplasmic adaptor subunit [Methylobacterium oryzihabitans]|uniref:Efflux RND transporter periplasmic adaptor subunit n=1 Tax=Methylobacterium oryzihabitans TaxID=2499852 RepID=A0A437P9Z0_9HYPH|nr:efflux RND transporter periplasmic adaptor subunit [Methylobacterium oryzihabitans]RVU19090.1 efflux RND transporter periplasmic adaptor subunit [Methylobacterium oryzihabitans]
MIRSLLLISGSVWAGVAAAQQPPAPAAPPALKRIDAHLFDCLMDAAERVKLNAEVSGFLRSVQVGRGDRVRAGQVVARLGSGVEEANVVLARLRAENDAPIAAAQAKLDLARRRLARITALRERNVISEKDSDEAIADAKVAELTLQDAVASQKAARAELVRAQEQVAQRELRSPIDGVVVERRLAPGEYVHDQVYVFGLADIATLHVEVYVPVSFYGQVTVGSRATVFPEAPVGGSHSAEVTIVDRVMEATSGTFGVRLKLPNPDWALPAGLRCQVRFGPSPTARAE